MKNLLIIIIAIAFWNSPVFGQKKDVRLSTEVRRITHKMDNYGRIDSDAVGYAASRTEQYDRFERLLKTATLNELLILMEHKSPVVKGYAFWALAKSDYLELESIYYKYKTDTTYVDVIQGCLGGEMPLNGFLDWVVTPKTWDLECKKLKK